MVVSLESGRLRLLGGIYWLVSLAAVVFDGSFVGSDPPLNLVIRDQRTRVILHSEGPYAGAEAVNAAKEAARVIGVLGVQGYLNRERSD